MLTQIVYNNNNKKTLLIIIPCLILTFIKNRFMSGVGLRILYMHPTVEWTYCSTAITPSPTLTQRNILPSQWSLDYSDCIPCTGVSTSTKKGAQSMKNLLQMVKLQFWRSTECRVPLHCHYSQLNSDPE